MAFLSVTTLKCYVPVEGLGLLKFVFFFEYKIVSWPFKNSLFHLVNLLYH
jgi:hypothetical protein